MWRVRTVLTGLAGSPYLNTFYFDDDSAQTAQDAADAVGAFWTAVDAFLPNTLSWSTEAAVDQLGVDGVLTGSTPTSTSNGTGAINAVLHNPATQALVRWNTGQFLGGRELRGRTYIPGMSNSTNTSSGTPDPTFTAAVDAAAEGLISDPNSELLVWSKRWSSSATVAAASVWNQWAVLRSRRD